MIAYKEQFNVTQEAGIERPPIPNYIGECIMKIATNLSHKSNFNNYTYKDDMVLDGIENCILYIDKFDATKYNNPFAYFTQIIFFAFLRRIAKEKKQTEIKNMLIQDMVLDMCELQEHDEDGNYINSYVNFMQNVQPIKEDSSFTKKKGIIKNVAPSLDEFLEEDFEA